MVAYIKPEKRMYNMPLSLTVSCDKEFLDRLKERYGAENVALKYKDFSFSRY